MSAKRYTEEFRIEAVKQVTDRGHPVAEVASRLGVTTHSLYQWLKCYRVRPAEREAVQDQQMVGVVRRLACRQGFTPPGCRAYVRLGNALAPAGARL